MFGLSASVQLDNCTLQDNIGGSGHRWFIIAQFAVPNKRRHLVVHLGSPWVCLLAPPVVAKQSQMACRNQLSGEQAQRSVKRGFAQQERTRGRSGRQAFGSTHAGIAAGSKVQTQILRTGGSEYCAVYSIEAPLSISPFYQTAKLATGAPQRGSKKFHRQQASLASRSARTRTGYSTPFCRMATTTAFQEPWLLSRL